MAQMTVVYLTNASLAALRTYDDRAFTFISADDVTDAIVDAAAEEGVSPAAIAGIMAKTRTGISFYCSWPTSSTVTHGIAMPTV